MLSRLFNISTFSSSLATSDSQEDTLKSLLEIKPGHSYKVLICGPPSCGKTSIMFELAMSFADEGKHVLFVTPRKPERLPLRVSRRVTPTTQTLKLIQMVYTEDREEFLKYMARVHLTQMSVHAILVDGIDHFFGGTARNQELAAMAKVLAFTVDAFSFKMKKLEEAQLNTAGVLAVSVDLPGGATTIPHHQLYERWVDYILKIKPSQNQEHVMSIYPAGCHNNKPLIDVRYRTTSEEISVLNVQCLADL